MTELERRLNSAAVEFIPCKPPSKTPQRLPGLSCEGVEWHSEVDPSGREPDEHGQDQTFFADATWWGGAAYYDWAGGDYLAADASVSVCLS